MDWKERYQILAPLSESFKGALFLAEDQQTLQTVICRVLYHSTADHYRLLQQVSSPHVPRIFAILRDEEDTIVIEEYIQGETLEDMRKKGHVFSLSEILNITTQLCQALQAIHACGVIHRDIKPSNILLDGNRTVLIDFDAARQYHAQQRRDTVYMGTEGYAAPEQYGFAQTDSRSDIYALGVVLRELCGENPSHPLWPVICRCTAFDPSNRYASAEEILSDLERMGLLSKNHPASPISAPLPKYASSIAHIKKVLKTVLSVFFILEAVIVMIRMPHEVTTQDYIFSKLVYLSIVIFPAALFLNLLHLWDWFPLLRSHQKGKQVLGVIVYFLLFLVIIIALNGLAYAFYSQEALEILQTPSV